MGITATRGIRRRMGALLVVGMLVAGCAGGGATGGHEAAEGAGVKGAEVDGAAPEVPVDAPIEDAPLDVPADDGDVPARDAANPFVTTASDPQSTFALDVDTGSYTLARAALRSGTLPEPSQIRVEEFVNAVDQNYPSPAPEDVFEVVADGTSWPYGEATDRRLVRIGLSTATEVGERLPASLTFVVDTSGSMADAGRLDLVRDSLSLLVDNLRPDDTVALVTYSDDAELILPPTPATQADQIRGAISELQPDGSTNLAAGLDLGYSLARETLREGGINRVVLASDGVANVGLTDGGSILETIRTDAEQGIEMVTVGVGLGDFNDALMEQLADDGDGFYAYVDSLDEAEQLFGVDLTATLQTVAREARVRVDFEPQVVEGYRLLGFENRDLPDEQFRDDSRDAGEIGAGHQVTALYEVDLTGAPGRLATTRVRWQDPTDGEVHEIARNIDVTTVSEEFTLADPVLQLDSVVAAWAAAMRNDGTALADPQTLAADAANVAERLGTAQAAEIATLIARWAELT